MAGWEKGTEIGTAARNPTKGGIKSEQQEDGEGRGGIPTGWEPALGAAGMAQNGVGQTGRNAVGQAASLPQQALPVPQRLQAACDTMHGQGSSQSAWQLRSHPRCPSPGPAPPGTTAVRRSPLQLGQLHPDTGGDVCLGCYLSGASSPLLLPCTGSSLYILVP